MTSAREAIAITPNDSTNLARFPSALYVGGAGDIRVIMAHDNEEVPTPVVFKAVPVGTVLNISVKRVYATSTTATFLVGLFS